MSAVTTPTFANVEDALVNRDCRRVFKCLTFGRDGARSVAIVGGCGAGLGYLLTLRLMTDELTLFSYFCTRRRS